jgi:hypothetical protein
MKAFIGIFKILLFILILSLPFNLQSQNSIEASCNYKTTNETLAYFNKLKPQLKSFELQFLSSKGSKNKSSSTSKNYIPIKIHVIRTSHGTGGISEYELEEAINNLNALFANAFMEFTICDDINYIDSDSFYQFSLNKENALVNENYKKGVLNIYFSDIIINNSDENICGYTYNKDDYDIIVIQNDCATNGSSLAHEVGHYFSLIHTHGSDNNQLTQELVNGSNCAETGDQICDTPADPKLTIKNVNNFCRYIGNETDANGALYVPDTKNIMSYSMKGCRSHFSNEQLARMYAYYMVAKNYLNCSEDSDDKSLVKNNISESLNVKIYPNPITNDIIHVKQFTDEKYTHFEISNLMGQVFASGKLSDQPIHVNHLASGSYLIALRNSHSKIVKRLIK